MKILFTRNVKKVFVKNYEYLGALFILFAVLSYFSTPTNMVQTMGESNGLIIRLEKEREFSSSIKSPSRGYSDFYNLYLKDDDIAYRCYAVEEINHYGIENIIHHKASLQFNDKGEYKIIRKFNIENDYLINTSDRGLYPFLLFVGMSAITLLWSIWGFYITYIVSDKKRKEILGR